MVNGIVDYLDNKNVKIFGPSKFSSQLEGSKAFLKNLCKENNIPTANFGIFETIEDAKNFIRKNEINSYKANPKLAQKIIKWKNKLKLKDIVTKMVNEELF